MSQRKHYVRNVAAQGLSRLLSVGANLVTFVVVARILGAEVFGQFAFVMAYLNIACSAADMGTTAVLAKGLAEARDRKPEEYLGNFLFLRLTLVLCVTALAFTGVIFLDESIRPYLLIISFSIPVVASRFFEPIFQIFERPWNSVHASTVYSLSQLALTLVLLVWLQRPLLEYLYGFFVANLIYTLVAFGLAFRLIKPRFSFNWPVLRATLALSGPVGVAGFFTIINRRADVMMLNELHTPFDAGLYSAAYKFLDFAAILAVTLTTPLIPILARKIVQGKSAAKPACLQMMQLIALVSFPVVILAPYLAEWVVTFIYGAEYVEASRIIGILAVVFVLIVYSLVGSAINLAIGDVAHGYWNGALAATINVGLNLMVIPTYGFVGAAWTTLISHLSLLLVSQAYVYRNMGNLVFTVPMLKILLLNVLLAGLVYSAVHTGREWLAALALVLYVLCGYALKLADVSTIRKVGA